MGYDFSLSDVSHISTNPFPPSPVKIFVDLFSLSRYIKKKEVVLSEEKKGLWAEKTLNLRISAKEHRAIKLLATEAGMTIKDFVFKALDAFSPNWRDKGNS